MLAVAQGESILYDAFYIIRGSAGDRPQRATPMMPAVVRREERGK